MISISTPAIVEFYVSTKSTNPGPDDHEKFFDNVDSFTMFLEDWGTFRYIY